MKLKHIKTFIFLMIFVVFASFLIYNYMKRPTEAPQIIQYFDRAVVTSDNVSDISGSVFVTETEEAEQESNASEPESGSGLININTASQTELESLPGIGPVKAKAIIEYRTVYNGFIALEEIMEVRGIGPATFEKIKDKITLE